MNDGKDKDRQPATDRQISQQQARANMDAARATRKSHREGVDDDSEIVESLVGTLAAPVEGTRDSMRGRERSAAGGEDPGPDQAGGVTGQREGDLPHDDRDRGKVPTKPEDAEAEPRDIAEDMTRDRPGAQGRRSGSGKG